MSRSLCGRLATFFGASCVLAAVAAGAPALADPPARVGRLSEVAGIVSFHSAGEDQWSPAVLNEPVTSGNSFWTEPRSRAELRIGSTAVHLDSSTELDIDTLDDHQFAARLPQGTLNVHIFRFQGGDGYTIATPRGTVTLNAVGTYHIEAGSDVIPTKVATLQGAAQVVDNQASLTLTHGEAAIISGTDQVSFAIEEAQPTPFDDDSLARDRREAQPRPAARYVSPEMTGYEDLDDYGTWRPSPEYGPVWYPQQVPVNWAPYREGHWRWIEPWGWTWVDDEPWGFAPFHYGRWAFIGGRWGWVPGTVVVRPVYAPALVAFVGGAGWSLSVAVAQEPAIGWFPLAPREVYVPSYPASINYVRNVNVTNVTNVTNINVTNVNVTKVNYVNRQFATVVPQTAFAASRPVKAAALDVPRNAIAAAPVASGAPLTPAVAAETKHPEAVARAKAVAQAQAAAPAPAAPQSPQAPTPPTAAKPAQAANTTPQAGKPAAPVAPGPPIAPNAKAGEKQPAEAGQAKPGTPAATALPAAKPTPSDASAQPAAPGPRINHAAQVPEPAQAHPPTAAAPAPSINRAATPAPEAPTHAAQAPEAAPPKPPVVAAPGPPINRAATPVPQAPTHAVTVPEPAQAKSPAAVIPSPPVNHAAPPIPAPTPPASQAQQHAPAPVAAAPAPPVNHGASQAVNRPVEPVQRAAPQNQTRSVPPPPQVVHGAAPAIARAPNPPPPERNVPRPVQQTQLQPTQQGWVRTPPPPPPQQQPPAQQQAKPAAQPKKGNPPGQPDQKHE